MRSVATASEVEHAIADLIDHLQKGIRVEAVVLYGSYALGNPDERSDIDIAIVSPDFEGLPLSQRQEMISRFSVHRYPRLSPIGFASSEYRQPRPDSFLTEILRSGKVVYQAD